MQLWISSAGIVSVLRSRVFARGLGLRGLCIEGLLGFGSVLLAALLVGPSLLASMASVWGFWLVQAARGLVHVWPARPGPGDTTADPYVQAATRLESLLEEPGV